MVVDLRDCSFEEEPDSSSIDGGLFHGFVAQWRLVVEFEVDGYDEEEVAALWEMLREPEVKECEEIFVLVVGHLRWFLPREQVLTVFELRGC